MNAPLVILDRYRGPARSGNGGYVAGALAARLLGGTGSDRSPDHGVDQARPVTVSLRRPPPLESPMEVEETDAGLQARFGGAVVATATLAEEPPETLEPVSLEEAQAASATYPGLLRHPFPTCFACGPDRPDGLRIFPGRIDRGSGGSDAADGPVRVAAPWIPDPSIAQDVHRTSGPEARACLAATWAALDCAGGWAGSDLGLADRLMVLGRMTCLVDDLPVIGEPHVVVGQHRGTEGRKTFTATTVYDADGRVIGSAEHLWVAVDPDLFD